MAGYFGYSGNTNYANGGDIMSMQPRRDKKGNFTFDTGGDAPFTTGESEQKQSSSTFFSDPGQAAHLSSIMEGLIGGAGTDYLEFIRNPTASPYFQNAYQGILSALKPEETRMRQGTEDIFRAAGGLRGDAHAAQVGQDTTDIYGKQMAGLTDLLTKLFPQVTNALFAPISETDAIMNALKLQESSGSSTSSQFGWEPQQGGGGGGGGNIKIGGTTGISSLQSNFGGFNDRALNPSDYVY